MQHAAIVEYNALHQHWDSLAIPAQSMPITVTEAAGGSIPTNRLKVAVGIPSLGRRVPPKSVTKVRGGRQLYGALHDRRIRGSTKHASRSSLFSTSYLFHHPACSGGLGSSRPHWIDCLVSRDLTRKNEGAVNVAAATAPSLVSRVIPRHVPQ